MRIDYWHFFRIHEAAAIEAVSFFENADQRPAAQTKYL